MGLYVDVGLDLRRLMVSCAPCHRHPPMALGVPPVFSVQPVGALGREGHIRDSPARVSDDAGSGGSAVPTCHRRRG